jgi:uncharacterized protein (UPF0210 family)
MSYQRLARLLSCALLLAAASLAGAKIPDYSKPKVRAYSAVCGTGLDTVPYTGDISEEQLEKIMGDVASLAWKWHKPLSARLQPVQGKHAGEQTEFHSQYLFNTTLQPLSK